MDSLKQRAEQQKLKALRAEKAFQQRLEALKKVEEENQKRAARKAAREAKRFQFQAAVRIQKLARGALVRRRGLLSKARRALLTIQCSVRVFLAKCRTAALRKQREEEAIALISFKAAARIQSLFRGQQGRKAAYFHRKLRQILREREAVKVLDVWMARMYRRVKKKKSIHKRERIKYLWFSSFARKIQLCYQTHCLRKQLAQQRQGSDSRKGPRKEKTGPSAAPAVQRSAARKAEGTSGGNEGAKDGAQVAARRSRASSDSDRPRPTSTTGATSPITNPREKMEEVADKKATDVAPSEHTTDKPSKEQLKRDRSLFKMKPYEEPVRQVKPPTEEDPFHLDDRDKALALEEQLRKRREEKKRAEKEMQRAKQLEIERQKQLEEAEQKRLEAIREAAKQREAEELRKKKEAAREKRERKLMFKEEEPYYRERLERRKAIEKRKKEKRIEKERKRREEIEAQKRAEEERKQQEKAEKTERAMKEVEKRLQKRMEEEREKKRMQEEEERRKEYEKQQKAKEEEERAALAAAQAAQRLKERQEQEAEKAAVKQKEKMKKEASKRQLREYMENQDWRQQRRREAAMRRSNSPTKMRKQPKKRGQGKKKRAKPLTLAGELGLEDHSFSDSSDSSGGSSMGRSRSPIQSRPNLERVAAAYGMGGQLSTAPSPGLLREMQAWSSPPREEPRRAKAAKKADKKPSRGRGLSNGQVSPSAVAGPSSAKQGSVVLPSFSKPGEAPLPPKRKSRPHSSKALRESQSSAAIEGRVQPQGERLNTGASSRSEGDNSMRANAALAFSTPTLPTISGPSITSHSRAMIQKLQKKDMNLLKAYGAMPTLPATKKKASDAPASADDGQSHLKASEATAEKPQQIIEEKEEYLVTEGVRRVKAASEAVSVPLSHIASTHIARSKPRHTKTKSKKKQKQSRGAPGGPSIPSAVDLLPDNKPSDDRSFSPINVPGIPPPIVELPSITKPPSPVGRQVVAPPPAYLPSTTEEFSQQRIPAEHGRGAWQRAKQTDPQPSTQRLAALASDSDTESEEDSSEAESFDSYNEEDDLTLL